MTADALPEIIQGGMGVGVSGWELAKAVSIAGGLGIISGVALDAQLIRKLQLGDINGHIRQALSHFPLKKLANQIVERYFVEGGIDETKAFKPVLLPSLDQTEFAEGVTIAGNFVEVHLAKEGHSNPVGINYLEKIQMATPSALYGAMLAGVDYVVAGAGIPAEFPSLIEDLSYGKESHISVDVIGAKDRKFSIGIIPKLKDKIKRPKFFAIVASHVLANFLARSDRTKPDGFVVESPIAGGHSAPPRGHLVLDDAGQPIYGERDVVDFSKMKEIGLPFYIAGSMASKEGLQSAKELGASGVQVGSAFALCKESAMNDDIKHEIINKSLDGTLEVFNDPVSSPTGFPFKVAKLDKTVSDEVVYKERKRVCDAGYLRVPVLDENNEITYRCSAEPEKAFVRKGGNMDETSERRCLCNGLLATIGLGQRRPIKSLVGRRSKTEYDNENLSERIWREEPPIVTMGQDMSFLKPIVSKYGLDYSAKDVIDYMTA